MENYRAIPDGFMRIGEIAKKADVSVRTLQYYDKEGLLSPSAQSEGGFRLYNEKDMAKLAQILMMKALGFPLSEIKKRLVSLDTKTDVMGMLTDQISHIRKKIEILQESASAIETLKDEIALMETVDFRRYTAIFINLQIKNKNYWMIKHFDDDVLEQLAENMNIEEAKVFINKINRLYEEADKLMQEGVSSDSDTGQVLAKEFWDVMLKITRGDFELIQKINNHVNRINASSDTQRDFYKKTNSFLGSALETYLANQN